MTDKRRPPVTASDLLADPEVAAGQAELRARLERNREEYARAAAPVLGALRAVGYDVDSVGDIRRLGKPYPDAVPVLVEWLSRVEDRHVKEDIVRTLSVPWAKKLAFQPLLAEFVGLPLPADPAADGLRGAVANALECLAGPAVRDELVAIASDRRYGQARGMVVLALAKTKDPSVADVLAEQLRDEDVAWFAAKALAKLGTPAPRALSALAEVAREHPRADVRREAERALAALRG